MIILEYILYKMYMKEKANFCHVYELKPNKRNSNVYLLVQFPLNDYFISVLALQNEVDAYLIIII